MDLKAIQALRLRYLYDGSKNAALAIPSLSTFVKNHYKGREVADISAAKLNKIVNLSSYVEIDNEFKYHKSFLFCLRSFINHHAKSNVS